MPREAPDPETTKAFEALLAHEDVSENDIQRFLEQHGVHRDPAPAQSC